MVRDGGAASVGMAVLQVGAALADHDKTQGIEDATDLAWLENGSSRHELRSDGDALGADKLGVQIGLAVLQKHLNHFAEIALQLVERLALGMRTGKTGDGTNVKPGSRTTLDDRSESFHGREGIAARIRSQ